MGCIVLCTACKHTHTHVYSLIHRFSVHIYIRTCYCMCAQAHNLKTTQTFFAWLVMMIVIYLIFYNYVYYVKKIISQVTMRCVACPIGCAYIGRNMLLGVYNTVEHSYITNQKFQVKLFVISRNLLYQNNFP